VLEVKFSEKSFNRRAVKVFSINIFAALICGYEI